MLSKFFGGEWAGMVGRTFLQAALPVVVAAGTDWVNVELWKVAALSGGSAVFAYVQGKLRDK